MAAEPSARGETLRTAFEALHDGRYHAAAEATRPFVSDHDIEARLIHALALGGAGEAGSAAAMLCRIAGENPTAMHPCQDLSTLLTGQQRPAAAEPIFLAALALTPDEPRLLLAWGDYLAGRWRPEEAETVLRRCLRIRPNDLATMNQLGIVLTALGRIDEGLAIFRDVVAISPSNHAAWANLGCALANEGEFEAALSYYHRAIRLRPNAAQIRLNHSVCLLKAGRMTQGWTEHEWRLALPGHTELPRRMMLPTLSPASDLTGKTVLVTQEEGLGDTLMYLRYAPRLADRGAKVILWVPQTLHRLAERIDPRMEVVSGDVSDPEFTWHCPFISLPRAFAGIQDETGWPVPYLKTDPEQVAAFANLLPHGDARPRIGLAWGGAPRATDPVANGIDRRRSIGLAALAPLAGVQGIQLISLQKGPYSEELATSCPPGLAVFDATAHLRDMDDTASLVQSLDLVVTVDTSIVHLAGGLGVPTILLDRYDNCWRWRHLREDSDWYPSLRIIRQGRPGDWQGVVARLVAELTQRQAGLPARVASATSTSRPRRR